MNDDWLLTVNESLSRLGSELGIDQTVWADREELERITYNDADFSRDKVFGLQLDTVSMVVTAYGDALQCRFRLGGLTVLDIGPETDAQAFLDFQDETIHSPTVELDLCLDKKSLLDRRLGTATTARLFLYLNSSSLERLLTSDLLRLESLLWGGATTQKAILLVPDREIWLDGPYLAVIGKERVEEWRVVIPTTLDTDQPGVQYKLCRKHTNWQSEHVLHLTPSHWHLHGTSLPGDQIHSALRVHGVNTFILYTADRTALDANKGLLGVYEGGGQKVDVRLGDPASPFPEEAAQDINDLLKIVDWAYEPRWVTDRLLMVQRSLAQTLGTVEEVTRLQLLMRNARDVFGALIWHWEAFIAGKIDAYQAQVKTLEDDVRITVQALGEQVSAIVKSLSDTMLAAVGILIGSFIAALFNDQFKPSVFQLGMIAYAVYVLIFPLAYNMTNQWQVYDRSSSGFKRRLERFGQLLLATRIQEIVGDEVSNSEQRFQSWFGITVAGYLLLIVLMLAASLLVPQVFSQSVSQPGLGTIPTAVP